MVIRTYGRGRKARWWRKRGSWIRRGKRPAYKRRRTYRRRRYTGRVQRPTYYWRRVGTSSIACPLPGVTANFTVACELAQVSDYAYLIQEYEYFKIVKVVHRLKWQSETRYTNTGPLRPVTTEPPSSNNRPTCPVIYWSYIDKDGVYQSTTQTAAMTEPSYREATITPMKVHSRGWFPRFLAPLYASPVSTGYQGRTGWLPTTVEATGIEWYGMYCGITNLEQTTTRPSTTFDTELWLKVAFKGRRAGKLYKWR